MHKVDGQILVVIALAFSIGENASARLEIAQEPGKVIGECARSSPSKQRVSIAKDAEMNPVNRGSSCAERILVVEINAELQPYQFHMIPDLDAIGHSETRRHIGRIEISQLGANTVPQTIEVESHESCSALTQRFEAKDMSFDGYLDIALLDDHGAKWGTYNYWLFDRRSGRFVANTLTDDLRQLAANQIVVDPERREIHAIFLSAVCPGSQEVYRIVKGHLLLAQEEEHSAEGEDCIVIIKKRIHQHMVTVQTQKQQGAATNPP